VLVVHLLAQNVVAIKRNSRTCAVGFEPPFRDAKTSEIYIELELVQPKVSQGERAPSCGELNAQDPGINPSQTPGTRLQPRPIFVGQRDCWSFDGNCSNDATHLEDIVRSVVLLQWLYGYSCFKVDFSTQP
jgi:hypothetical protein